MDAAGERCGLQPLVLLAEHPHSVAGAYRERREPVLRSLDTARVISDVGERIRTLLRAQDKVGTLLRATLEPTLAYAARVAPEIVN